MHVRYKCFLLIHCCVCLASSPYNSFFDENNVSMKQTLVNQFLFLSLEKNTFLENKQWTDWTVS